jgi:hypothetical protein
MGRSGASSRGANRVEIARATETAGVAELEKALNRIGSQIRVRFAGDEYVSLTWDNGEELRLMQDPVPCMVAIMTVARMPQGTPDELIMDQLTAWSNGYRVGYQDGHDAAEAGEAFDSLR